VYWEFAIPFLQEKVNLGRDESKSSQFEKSMFFFFLTKGGTRSQELKFLWTNSVKAFGLP
jgi:hypothetical protein